MSRFVLLTLIVVVLVASGRVLAADETPVDWWGLHGQSTFVTQYHPGFHAAFSGPNSLDPQAQARETFDLTLIAGLRLWWGAELWANPEVDQGFGLSNTLGVAGFTSGEAYKVGAAVPYVELPRLFVRQTLNLGGEVAHIDAGLNQLAGSQTAHRVVVTVGKFGWCPSIACINEQRSDIDRSRVELCVKIACYVIAQQDFHGPCLVCDTCRHSGAIQFLSGMRLRESNYLRPGRTSREAISALRHMARRPPSHDDWGRWRTP